jgi:pimeloyl-ACP methyl ester carboxylesterase
MNQRNIHTFVLIAGAWHGGWVWRDVIPRLRKLGHVVTAPTLTGLGERRHNGNDDINLTTHVDDVVAHIEMEGLRSVTLVGWSYGGMVATGVASRIPHEIKTLVYVDSVVPEDGKALTDYLPADRRANVEKLIKEGNGVPPPPMGVYGVTDPVILNFIEPRLTPHPPRTLIEPIRAGSLNPDLAIGYVYCSGYGTTMFTPFYERAITDPRVRTAAVDTHHLCMLSEPQKTADALLSVV